MALACALRAVCGFAGALCDDEVALWAEELPAAVLVYQSAPRNVHPLGIPLVLCVPVGELRWVDRPPHGAGRAGRAGRADALRAEACLVLHMQGTVSYTHLTLPTKGIV